MQHTIDNGGASAMRENGNRCMDFDNDNSNGCDGGNHDYSELNKIEETLILFYRISIKHTFNCFSLSKDQMIM